MRVKPGRYRWFQVWGDAFRNEAGRPGRVAGGAPDVAERLVEDALRESQQRLLLALQSARMVTWDVDLRTGQVTGSPGHGRLLGFQDDVSPETLEQFLSRVHRDDRGPFENAFALARRTRSAYRHEYRAILPNGMVRWIASHGRVLLDASGEAVRMTGVAWDMTERKQAERRLEENSRRLKDLTRRLLELQESERRHLARELHDEIGQALTAVKVLLQRAIREGGDARERLDETIAVVDQTIRQVRGIALDLRPAMLDDLGLVAALRWYVERVAARTGLEGRFVVDPEEIRASKEVETACFRVAQEALTNMARHARARRFTVELLRGGKGLDLIVRDDGIGFDPDEAARRAAGGASLGLAGIRERVALVGGHVGFVSREGDGSAVRVFFPLTNPP